MMCSYQPTGQTHTTQYYETFYAHKLADHLRYATKDSRCSLNLTEREVIFRNLSLSYGGPQG